jgi:two-component system nitrate/nitrite response regulator NarL
MVCNDHSLKRKDEVSDLLKVGMSNSDIGETLCMSIRTVKHYMSIIMEELNVNNRTQAALKLNGLKICKLN